MLQCIYYPCLNLRWPLTCIEEVDTQQFLFCIRGRSGHPIPACNLSFGTGMYSVWNKIEKFILMHGECKQKWKKTTQKEYCKNTMQNIKRLVYCHCMEYSTRSNILSEVHSSEKNMNLRYFLSSLIFSRNVRPHISYIGNTHEPFYISICISTLHAYAVYNV